MTLTKPNLWQRLSAALAILTGRRYLFLGANKLNARWQVKPMGGSMMWIWLDIRINKKAYSAQRNFVCDPPDPAERKKIIEEVMTEMVTDVFRKVLVG